MQESIDYLKFCVPCIKCGAKPVLSNIGFKCPTCDNKHEVWGGIEFAIKNWNGYNSNILEDGKLDSFPKLVIDNEEWYWGSLDVRVLWLGRTEEYTKNFILFKTSKDSTEWFIDKKTGWTCIIDKPRHLPDLEIMDMSGIRYVVEWLNMPKSSSKAYAYICKHGNGFSNTSFPNVTLSTLSCKYNLLAGEMLKMFKLV